MKMSFEMNIEQPEFGFEEDSVAEEEERERRKNPLFPRYLTDLAPWLESFAGMQLTHSRLKQIQNGVIGLIIAIQKEWVKSRDEAIQKILFSAEQRVRATKQEYLDREETFREELNSIHEMYARKIAELKQTDPLTRLLNYVSFHEGLNLQFRIARPGNWILVGFIDLHGFKAVNDKVGHHVGDEILIKVADAVRANIRSDDLLTRERRKQDRNPQKINGSRRGGDEFCFAAEVDSRESAIKMGNRLRVALNEEGLLDLPILGKYKAWADIGVIYFQVPERGFSPPDVNFIVDKSIQAAEKCMYKAKNRVRHIEQRGGVNAGSPVDPVLHLEIRRSEIDHGQLKVFRDGNGVLFSLPFIDEEITEPR